MKVQTFFQCFFAYLAISWLTVRASNRDIISVVAVVLAPSSVVAVKQWSFIPSASYSIQPNSSSSCDIWTLHHLSISDDRNNNNNNNKALVNKAGLYTETRGWWHISAPDSRWMECSNRGIPGTTPLLSDVFDSISMFNIYNMQLESNRQVRYIYVWNKFACIIIIRHSVCKLSV